MVNKSRSFDAIRFQQGVGVEEGQEMYLLAAPAGWLIARTVIDRWRPDVVPEDDLERQGYQRAVAESHVKKIVRYLQGTLRGAESSRLLPVFPTSILLSARSELDFIPRDGQASSEGAWSVPGELRIPESLSLFVIDGQHRIEGLKTALEYAAEEERESLQSYYLPVTIMVCTNKLHELLYFYTINKTAKSVRTDLAERLIDIVYSTDPGEIRDGRVFRGAEERARALAIVKFLERTAGQPWFGRIAKPNERRKGNKVAGESQLTKSLRHVCAASPPHWSGERLTQFVVDFWRALAALLPDAFASPRDYLVQAAVGFGALHQVLPTLVSMYDHDRGVASLQRVLQGVEPFFTEPQYWRRGGTVTQYSSEGGYKRHAQLIKEALKDKFADE